MAILLPVGAGAQTVVREVIVEGAQRIEPETVRSYLLIRAGDAYDPARVDRSLKSLYATGLFADVSIRRDGDVLVVSVVENPVINRIAFEGNKKLDDEVLEPEISLRPRVIYTRTKVQNDVKRLLSVYRLNGRFAATVDPKVIQLPQNRVDLVFEISEGKATKIRRIRMVGNREYSDARLREEIRTKESRWWRFLSSDDTYDPDRLTVDRELLRRFYLSNGFADFRVVSDVAELTPNREDFFITFTLEEGPRYEFGKIELDIRLRDLDSEDLWDEVVIDPGDWYDAQEVDKTIDRLTNKVGLLGHPFVDVRPRVIRDRENRTIAVTFELNEGARVFVERIEITGNVRTSEEVIRREFRMVEGDAFNAAKLRRSRQRLNNLNFFGRVDIEQVPGNVPDKTVLKVDVEEKSTGSLTLGIGYSSSTGPLADFSIRERNLLGKGQDLKLGALIAASRSEIDLSFTEPYFLDREIAAGFDIRRVSRNLQDESSFDSRTTGGSLRAGYPITENLRQSWKYTIEKNEVTDVASDASIFVKAEEGTTMLSEVSHNLIYDRRDSAIRPTDGYIIRLTNDLAGLGGDTRYMRNQLRGVKYYPVDDQWVLSLSGTIGHIFGLGQDVNLLDRFFVGGNSLRGFTNSGIGPRDKTTKDALGGEWKYTATAELSFPVGLPAELGVKGRVFTDIGSSGKISPTGPTVEDTGSLRASVGTGVTWVSPFGPIGLDLGFPMLSEDFDELETLRINFGARF